MASGSHRDLGGAHVMAWVPYMAEASTRSVTMRRQLVYRLRVRCSAWLFHSD